MIAYQAIQDFLLPSISVSSLAYGMLEWIIHWWIKLWHSTNLAEPCVPTTLDPVTGILVSTSLLHAACAVTGLNWPGFTGLRYLFAFGDSYTSVGYSSWAPAPTDVNPLGVSYPGSTYIDGANWIGYLTTQYNQSKFWTYDYAVPGNTVEGVTNQVIADFLPHAGTKPAYAPWTATNSLFATFVGINDLNTGANIPSSMATLFDLQEVLYMAGARTFLFINVPPMNRAPLGNNNPNWASIVATWNTQLQIFASAFQAKYMDVTTFYYDSRSLYNKLLDNPSAYGFTDVNTTEGNFWYDAVHPRTKVHQYMAADLATFLQNQAPSVMNPFTPDPAARTTPPTASSALGVVSKYGQCGGSGYIRPTTCVSGLTCTYSNQWYSQCL
ncbi:hypothetical protein BDV93DRAFT_525072 [Ceratobasidium sp. AG-I]|nr:hypothetical protein BDV93DRAFT_525072 [Ceratobasidium sp. AG-I]